MDVPLLVEINTVGGWENDILNFWTLANMFSNAGVASYLLYELVYYLKGVLCILNFFLLLSVFELSILKKPVPSWVILHYLIRT